MGTDNEYTYSNGISDGGGLAVVDDFFWNTGETLTSFTDSMLSAVGEGLTLAYQGTSLPDFMSGIVAGANSFPTSTPSALQNVTSQDKIKERDESWGGMFKTFVKDNQKILIERGFGAIYGIAKTSAAIDAAKARAEADTAFMVKKDQLEQAANQRFSDSIGGLKPVKKYTPKPLTRLDGSRVFTPTGLINTGAK